MFGTNGLQVDVVIMESNILRLQHAALFCKKAEETLTAAIIKFFYAYLLAFI